MPRATAEVANSAEEARRADAEEKWERRRVQVAQLRELWNGRREPTPIGTTMAAEEQRGARFPEQMPLTVQREE